MSPDRSPCAAQRKSPSVHGPDPRDIAAGLRLRQRRHKLGLSQGQLGEKVSVTFQQIQKYERGVNRMSGSRMQDVARALGVSVDHFYPLTDVAPSLAASRDTLELVRLYQRLPKGTRAPIRHLMRSLAEFGAAADLTRVTPTSESLCLPPA